MQIIPRFDSIKQDADKRGPPRKSESIPKTIEAL